MAFLVGQLALHYRLPARLTELCQLLWVDRHLWGILMEAVPHLHEAFPRWQYLELWACGPPQPLVRAMVMLPHDAEQEGLDGIWKFDAGWWVEHFLDTSVQVAFDYELLPMS